MNAKYEEGKTYGYATFLFYINSIRTHVSHRMIPVKG